MELSEMLARFGEILEEARCELPPLEYQRFLSLVWDALVAYGPEPPWQRSED
jgi:hypothetical protein